MKTTIYEPTPEDRERWRLTWFRIKKQKRKEHDQVVTALLKLLLKQRRKP